MTSAIEGSVVVHLPSISYLRLHSFTRGVAILGDSASAHFHIPKDYMYAPGVTTSTYGRFLEILANEFDWPQQRYERLLKRMSYTLMWGAQCFTDTYL